MRYLFPLTLVMTRLFYLNSQVIETPSYVNELMGTPKQKESLVQMVSNLNILQLKWGRIDVRFGDPFSLALFVKKAEIQSKLPRGISQQNYILQSLGYRILGEINSITTIMPTALVGTVLLTLRGRGVGRNELIRRVKWVKAEILAKGAKVAESASSSTEVLVDRAVSVLSDLVGKRYGLYCLNCRYLRVCILSAKKV